MSKLTKERIDIIKGIRPMSYNMPGHEERMKEHCKRVQEEYFNSGLHEKELHGGHVPK